MGDITSKCIYCFPGAGPICTPHSALGHIRGRRLEMFYEKQFSEQEREREEKMLSW